MKIVILAGSPRKGNTATLAAAFQKGAQEAGHEVQYFDVAEMVVSPCIACNYCRENDGKCLLDDEMQQIYPQIIAADMVVFATPLYFLSYSAQLKAAIDRLHAIGPQLQESPKKAFLIVAAHSNNETSMDLIKAHYQRLCAHFHWQDAGMLLAQPLDGPEDAAKSPFPEQVRQLARQLA